MKKVMWKIKMDFEMEKNQDKIGKGRENLSK